MRFRKGKSIAAVAAAAVFCAACIAAPSMLGDLELERLLDGRAQSVDALQSELPSEDLLKNETALGLHSGRSLSDAAVDLGDEALLAELKQAGVVPQACIWTSHSTFDQESNGCLILIEPLSGTLRSAMWKSSEEPNPEQRLDALFELLGLSQIQDWQEVEYSSSTKEDIGCARYSRSLALYAIASGTKGGGYAGVYLRCCTEQEFEQLFGGE